MKLGAPEWLLLAPAIAVAAWMWPQLGLRRWLRAACMVLLVLILSRPLWRLTADGIDLWVLVDRSASAWGQLGKVLPEWEAILQRAQGADDRLRFVEFAATPTIRGAGEINVHDEQETRTALGLQFTLAQLDPSRLSRVLLLSDGYATEPLDAVMDPLVRLGVPLDYRLLAAEVGPDFRVAGLQTPQRVQPSESFLLEARIVGRTDGDVPYEVLRDGKSIGTGVAQVRGNEARLRFTERLQSAGAHQYIVRLAPSEDAHTENNSAETWIEVKAGARVLVVTAFEQDPVAEVLAQQGFTVEKINDPRSLNSGSLTGTRLVILNNVPAHRLPDDFTRSLPFYVREQGGGLLMAGGRASFGSGGYFGSVVDPLLPVSMELKKEHRKLRIAMAIVLDRSGSMAVSIGGSRTKMDLADEGSARAIELLGDSDLVSVLAVDSAAHRMVPLTEVGPNRAAMISEVRRIRSQGGGIFVYEGLKAGWEELKKADVGQRHLILFSDAADSEEPGDYRKLLQEMTSQGATVSVIGLGSEKDSDAGLLVDIAARGNGRIMFNSDPADLPALFAQETVAVARSAFLDEQTPVKATAGWLEIAARPIPWIERVDGYNLSYLKPGATAAALSGDEYLAPLVAFWQQGLGRSAAVSFPLAGDSSTAVRAWPQYADFLATLARWLGGEDLPPGLGMGTRLVGNQLELSLF